MSFSSKKFTFVSRFLHAFEEIDKRLGCSMILPNKVRSTPGRNLLSFRERDADGKKDVKSKKCLNPNLGSQCPSVDESETKVSFNNLFDIIVFIFNEILICSYDLYLIPHFKLDVFVDLLQSKHVCYNCQNLSPPSSAQNVSSDNQGASTPLSARPGKKIKDAQKTSPISNDASSRL